MIRDLTIEKKKEKLLENGYLIWKIGRTTYQFYLDDSEAYIFVLSSIGQGCNDILSEEHYRNISIKDDNLESIGITYLEKEKPKFTFEKCIYLSEFKDYIKYEV